MGVSNRLKHPYGYVANTVINSKELSFQTKGVYLYILSKPNEWDFSAERISSDSTTSEYLVLQSLVELEGAGLLIREKQPNGRVTYHIVDPVTESIVTKSQNPRSQERLGLERRGGSISKKELSKKEESKKDCLPAVMGGTPLSRLSKFYTRLYEDEFNGLKPKVNLRGKDGAVLKSLLKDYNEWQIAALMIEHFDAKDAKLIEAAYPITWISPRVNTYMNQIDDDLDFNDTGQVKKLVEECVINLTEK